MIETPLSRMLAIVGKRMTMPPEPNKQGCHSKGWTQKETVELREKVAQGMTFAAISRSMPGRTQASVKGKAQWLRLREPVQRPNKWTPAEDKIIVTMAKQGYTPAQVAEELPGRKADGVKGRAYRLRHYKGMDVPRFAR